ncbi:MAG: glycosyltransferase [Verrucomicrobiota bacterium]|nr:glycosyltransferase [Verrucomicrobiota bacterium]
MSRCDLHIHSRYSDRSEEWLFRRFDLPDSYSDPKQLYTQLRTAGMDFVTITDHDTIAGSLLIADQPGAFISEQVTTYFPQDPCKIHLLVWGITEAQHAAIVEVRDNIFDLQAYLRQQEIAHAVAHPLYSINGKLQASHLERLILLFKHFEGINGLRDALLSDLTQQIFTSLTPAKIDELANRHGLAPTHPEPWEKVLVGGSDDHGGMFLAFAYTETPAALTPNEFLNHVQGGRCTAQGQGGTPLALSHGFYNTVAQFVSDRFNHQLGPTAPLLEAMFSRFMEGRDPTEFSLREKADFVARGVMSGKIFDLAKRSNVSMWKELSDSFAKPEVKALAADEDSSTPPERRTFLMANMVCEQLAFRFFDKFVRQLNSGNFIESIQALSGIAPILVLLAPYIYGFHSQAPSRTWLRDIAQQFLGAIPPSLQNRKRAWFTDTLEDVNGVSTTIRKMAAAAKDAGEELVVVTSRRDLTINGIEIANFNPIGEFELPEYELQKLSFPPVLQILDYIQRERFTEIIISTPGPIGLTGLLAAKMLNLRTAAIYHTDFPEYIRILTEDSFLESLGWKFMQWLYSQQDTVYVNSEQYRRIWIEKGIEAEKLKILPRGLDTELFQPARRDEKFWHRYNNSDGDEVRLLYVGRVSKEKDLDVLAAAYRQLRDAGLPLRLYVVGDGPYAETMSSALPDAVFAGYLSGEELATAYASADLFVFPSTTDTFGNVVIEAQAAGLPVIVSNVGGPQELVEDNVDGLITRARDVDDFSAAIRRLVRDRALRAQMGTRAREKVVTRSWPNAFQKFWALTAN